MGVRVGRWGWAGGRGGCGNGQVTGCGKGVLQGFRHCVHSVVVGADLRVHIPQPAPNRSGITLPPIPCPPPSQISKHPMWAMSPPHTHTHTHTHLRHQVCQLGWCEYGCPGKGGRDLSQQLRHTAPCGQVHLTGGVGVAVCFGGGYINDELRKGEAARFVWGLVSLVCRSTTCEEAIINARHAFVMTSSAAHKRPQAPARLQIPSHPRRLHTRPPQAAAPPRPTHPHLPGRPGTAQ